MTDIIQSEVKVNAGRIAANAEFRRLKGASGNKLGVEAYRYDENGDERSDLLTVTTAHAALVAAGGGTLVFDADRTYTLPLTGALALSSNMSVEGNNALLDVRESSPVFLFDITGSVGAPVTPLNDMLYGAEYIEVPDSFDVAVGDWLEMGANRKQMTLENLQTPRIGQCNQVVKIEASATEGYQKLTIDTIIFADITNGQTFAPAHVIHHDATDTETFIERADACDRNTNTSVTFTWRDLDYLYVGQRSPWDSATFNFVGGEDSSGVIDDPSNADVTLVAEYWNGTEWLDAEIYDDGTNGWHQTGTVRHTARDTYWSDELGFWNNTTGIWKTSVVNNQWGVTYETPGDSSTQMLTPALFWMRYKLDGLATPDSIVLSEIGLTVCSGYLLVDDAYVQKRTPVKDVHLSNLRILGNTSATTIKCYYAHHVDFDNVAIDGSGGYAITIYGCSDVRVNGGHFEADRVDDTQDIGGTSYGIGLGGCSRHIIIDGATFERYRHAIVGQATLTGVARFLNITNCGFYNSRGYGVWNGHGQGDYLRFIGNTVINNQTRLLPDDTNYRRGLNLTNSNTIVANNHFSGGRYGITLIWGSNVIIQANQIMDTENVGRGITLAGFNMTNIQILDNTISRTSMCLELGGDLDMVTVQGNYFNRWDAAAIYLSEVAFKVRGLIVKGNTFDDNQYQTQGRAIEMSLYASVRGLMIQNNLFARMAAAGITSLQGTLLAPLWLQGNMALDTRYRLADHLKWETNIVRVPTGEGFSHIIADGVTDEWTVELTAAQKRDSSYLSDKVVVFPPDELDLKGCTYYAFISDDGEATLQITNNTGTSQTFDWGNWTLKLMRFYE